MAQLLPFVMDREQWMTLSWRLVLVVLVMVGQCTAGKTKMLFRVEGPDGPKTIKTFAEAEKLCIQNGGEIADNWRLRDAVSLKHYDKCAGCGWMKMIDKTWYKNYRPVCGNDEDKSKAYYKPCADSPAGEGLAGYDAYCFGDTSPELPPDAVPINIGTQRGYVYLLRQGDDQVIATESLAADVCSRRGAILATNDQVELAYYNGMSRCDCGWMRNFQAIVMQDSLTACKGTVGYIGCPYGTIKHAYCFVDANDDPRGEAAVDFKQLATNVYPLGVEGGATKVSGGYVYPTVGLQGENATMTIFAAYKTCKEQGGMVATPAQMTDALNKGMTWCECGWVWDKAKLTWNALVEGDGGVMEISTKLNKCDGKQGVIPCPLKNPTGAGWNVFCFKDCPKSCPKDSAWSTPPNSFRVTGGRVFHVEHINGKYKFKTKAEAADGCKQHYNSVLASSDQLKQAQENGMSRCRCGYLSDDKVSFPMYRAIDGCGGDYGVYPCPGPYTEIPEKGPNWDAYCFSKGT